MYHYFANKEELLLSLAVMGFEELRARFVNIGANPGTLTPVGAGARAYFGFAEAQPALFSVMFNERLLARHEGLREAEHRSLLEFQSLVETDGRFPTGQRANVATALWALGRGIAAITSSQPDGKLVPEMAEKLWAGVSYLINHPD
jgi:AcrR family transcriptional regulator